MVRVVNAGDEEEAKGHQIINGGSEMVRRTNLPDDIFPCKDCLLIVCQRYADKRTEINDSMDTLLIYEGGEIIKRIPIRKMSPGCRYCKGCFSYEMSLI